MQTIEPKADPQYVAERAAHGARSKEARSAYMAAWHRANLDERRRNASEWYEKNKGSIDRVKKSEYLRAYYRENKDKWKGRTPEQQAAYNARRREQYAGSESLRIQARKASREWQEQNPAKRKAQRLKVYGITPAEYDALLARQGGGCALCGWSDASNKKMFPHVDHCHVTGRVRGILCDNCNMAIGKMKDNPDRLRAAAAYLERGRG